MHGGALSGRGGPRACAGGVALGASEPVVAALGDRSRYQAELLGVCRAPERQPRTSPLGERRRSPEYRGQSGAAAEMFSCWGARRDQGEVDSAAAVGGRTARRGRDWGATSAGDLTLLISWGGSLGT